MPTAREIDEAAARSLLRRSRTKPLIMAGAGAVLLLLCVGAAALLDPREDAPRKKTAEPAAEAAATPGPVAPPPKSSSDRAPRSMLSPSEIEEAAKATAKKPERKPVPAAPEAPSATRVYVVLVGICLALGGGAWLLKERLKNGRTAPGKEKLLIVRDQLALDPKRRIVVLGVENRTLVVGVVGDQMTLLSEYSAAEPDAEERAAAEAPTTPHQAVQSSEPFDAASALAAEERDVVAAYRRPTERAAEAAAEERFGTYVPRTAARPAPAPAFERPAAAARTETPTSPFRRIDAPAPTPKPRAAVTDRFRTLLEAASAENAR
jgi:flagellar biogenesis protein FliO